MSHQEERSARLWERRASWKGLYLMKRTFCAKETNGRQGEREIRDRPRENVSLSLSFSVRELLLLRNFIISGFN